MSKVVKAMNVMITNPQRIADVSPGRDRNEIFFHYLGGHKWSLVCTPRNEYTLFYYPGDDFTLEQLASFEDEGWEHVDRVNYNASELGGREAVESMSELFRVLKEKVFGVEGVFDEIIQADEIPF